MSKEKIFALLKINVLGNSIESYLVCLLAFFLFATLFKIFQKIILSRLTKLAEKTKNDIDDEFIRIVKSIKPPFYFFLALYFALKFLEIKESVAAILNSILIVWVIYQVIIALQILINYIVRKKFHPEDQHSKMALGVISFLVKLTLWSIALILVLDNIGVNVTSLIAGLGIGGIAVALAVQNILGDLFSSFTIYFDKPFKVGDFIVFGDKMGTVQKIGIKTTRVKALQGEEIVIPNKDLTSGIVHNFKKLERRRIVFNIGVVYQTPSEKLKKIPQIIKEIIDNIDGASFDRAHFKSFGDFALIFEIVYYVESSDYTKYMDVQQAINLRLKEEFEKEGIEFAYPTQTIFLAK